MNLGKGSFTFAIWARGPWKTTVSPWGDGNSSDNDYWWDNPDFDSANTGIGPRSDPNFRQNWNGGVVNPGGIQASPFPAGGCDYRRLQCLHGGVMNSLAVSRQYFRMGPSVAVDVAHPIGPRVDVQLDLGWDYLNTDDTHPLDSWFFNPVAHQYEDKTSFDISGAGSGAHCTITVLDGHKVLAQQQYVSN